MNFPMKTSSAKQKQPTKQSKSKVETPTLKLARSRFNRAKQRALATKAALKRAKKAFKKVKRDAKAARKRVKELKRELNEILAGGTKRGATPAKENQSKTAKRAEASKAKPAAKSGTKPRIVGTAGSSAAKDTAHTSGGEQGAPAIAATGR